MRGSIVTLFLSGVAASLWSVSAPASDCELTTRGGHCSVASARSSQMPGLSAGNGQLSFAQLLELSDPGQTPDGSESDVLLLSVLDEPASTSTASATPVSEVRSGMDSLAVLSETASIPEPGSGATLIAGLLGIYAVVRRRIPSS